VVLDTIKKTKKAIALKKAQPSLDAKKKTTQKLAKAKKTVLSSTRKTNESMGKKFGSSSKRTNVANPTKSASINHAKGVQERDSASNKAASNKAKTKAAVTDAKSAASKAARTAVKGAGIATAVVVAKDAVKAVRSLKGGKKKSDVASFGAKGRNKVNDSKAGKKATAVKRSKAMTSTDVKNKAKKKK